MKLKAGPNEKTGKVHLTIGQTTYALKPEAAIKLAESLANAAQKAHTTQLGAYGDQLANLMQNLYKK